MSFWLAPASVLSRTRGPARRTPEHTSCRVAIPISQLSSRLPNAVLSRSLDLTVRLAPQIRAKKKRSYHSNCQYYIQPWPICMYSHKGGFFSLICVVCIFTYIDVGDCFCHDLPLSVQYCVVCQVGGWVLTTYESPILQSSPAM